MSELDNYQQLLDSDPTIREAVNRQIDDAKHVFSPTGLASWLDGAVALNKLGRGAPVVVSFLDTMPDIARECGEDIVADCLGAAMKLSSMTSGGVIILMFRSLPIAARHLGDATLVRSYLSFIHQFASSTARALRPMLMHMDDLLSKLTLSGLRRWANFGSQAYRRDYDNQVAYFSLESADSRAVLQKERRGVLFVRVQRKLNLYLRALWGRDFYLRPAGSDHLDSRPFIEQRVLHLPDAVDDIGDIAGLELYRATAAHMAAHLCYTREAVSAEQLSPAQMFFIALMEDARVEYQAVRAFPGINTLWRALLADDSTAQVEHPSLLLLKHVALMLNDDSQTSEDAEIQAFVTRWHAGIEQHQNDSGFSWQLGMELFNVLAARRAVPSLRLLHQIPIAYRDDNRIVWDAEAFSAFSESEYLPARQQQIRRHVGLMEMINELDNELADDSAQEIWTCSSELFPYEDDLQTTQSFNDMWGKEAVSEPYHYQEWDYQVQLHRPDWATVYERHQPKGDPALIEAILSEYKPVANRIRQIIDLLTPAGVQRMRNQEDGDEIDLNAAIDAMVAIRMGVQPSSRITMRNVLNERDLAVIVLMDLSESTNESIGGAEKTVLQLTREAVTLVSTAIHGIGDSFAVTGFASDGRHDIQYFKFKDFNQHYDDEAKARLAGMQGGLSTRMGAALRHSGYLLSRQPERRKLILLVTDGEPADIDERDPQHLRHDTKKAVEELHTQGVFTYCLTLDPNADAYVKRIFGENHYTVVDDVERLPEKLPSLFASLTG